MSLRGTDVRRQVGKVSSQKWLVPALSEERPFTCRGARSLTVFNFPVALRGILNDVGQLANRFLRGSAHKYPGGFRLVRIS